MKQKTSKLHKIERARYSILTEDMDHCFICGRSPADIHEVYGGANRLPSMKNGFCVPLCRTHHELAHNRNEMALSLKRACQFTYEETHSREEFMTIIGKNYL